MEKIKLENGTNIILDSSIQSNRGKGILDQYRTKWYYYHHAESGCVWRSDEQFDWSHSDGCVEETDKEHYERLLVEYEQEDKVEGHYWIYNTKDLEKELFKPTLRDIDTRPIVNISGYWQYYIKDLKKWFESTRSDKLFVDIGRGYYITKQTVQELLTLWMLEEKDLQLE